MPLLRVCNICGIEASTVEELSLFKKNKLAKYGRAPTCKDCHREEHRLYKMERKGQYAAYEAKRRALKLKATVDKEEGKRIQLMYEVCNMITSITGVQYHARLIYLCRR